MTARADRPSLGSLICPRSIAVLGASPNFQKINGRPLKHLLEKGYAGSLYPVNPKYERIADLPCYRSMEAIPDRVDLAIVALPASQVISAIRDLGSKGVPAAIVFSSGFGETGHEGRKLEAELVGEAKRAGVRLCGPNCLGLINAFDRVIATFSQYASGETPPGPIGFVTQSGAFGTAIAALARMRGNALGYFINTGNEADVTFAEVMRYVMDDPRIRIGAGYIEGLKDHGAFAALAEHALSLAKPLVVTKVGRTGAGARAVASHTGSLAGSDEAFEAMVKRHGIVRARNEEEMLDVVEVLSACALPGGNGLGLVTQSGGAGVLMADRAEALGLRVPVPGDGTRRALQEVIPQFGSAGNPVDVTGQFVAQPELLRESVRILLADPQLHVGIVWLQLMHGYVDSLIRVFTEIKSSTSKPVVVAWVAAPEKGVAALKALGIPVLRGAEPAVDAVAALVQYAEARRRWVADRSEHREPTSQLP